MAERVISIPLEKGARATITDEGAEFVITDAPAACETICSKQGLRLPCLDITGPPGLPPGPVEAELALTYVEEQWEGKGWTPTPLPLRDPTDKKPKGAKEHKYRSATREQQTLSLTLSRSPGASNFSLKDSRGKEVRYHEGIKSADGVHDKRRRKTFIEIRLDSLSINGNPCKLTADCIKIGPFKRIVDKTVKRRNGETVPEACALLSEPQSEPLRASLGLPSSSTSAAASTPSASATLPPLPPFDLPSPAGLSAHMSVLELAAAAAAAASPLSASAAPPQDQTADLAQPSSCQELQEQELKARLSLIDPGLLEIFDRDADFSPLLSADQGYPSPHDRPPPSPSPSWKRPHDNEDEDHSPSNSKRMALDMEPSSLFNDEEFAEFEELWNTMKHILPPTLTDLNFVDSNFDNMDYSSSTPAAAAHLSATPESADQAGSDL